MKPETCRLKMARIESSDSWVRPISGMHVTAFSASVVRHIARNILTTKESLS